MEPEERFARIESLLHAMTERGNQMEIRFNKRMEQAEKRMDRADQRHEEAMRRLDRAEQRMEKFDKRLEATRKLVEGGMKIVLRMDSQLASLTESVKELQKSQKAFLDSLKKGGNGSKRAA
ncbi:MAG: hypothetical protein LAO55_04490 [Acidobacteriia bacterium]|nr:hypothetical protein [Terriglobia bacterium]